MRSDGLCLSKKQDVYKCLATLKKSIKHTFHKAEYADKMQFYKIKSF